MLSPAFLIRGIVLPLSLVVCLVVSADAQHGGGGGHGGFGGGHFGGGHSSHGRSGGKSSARSKEGSRTGSHHLGWLHFWSRGRSATSVSAASPRSSLDLMKAAPLHPLPSTYIRTEPIAPARPVARTEFRATPRFRQRSNFFFRPFPCIRPSGCYFNGFNQVCFFEPGLFFSGFGFSFYDYGFDDSGMNSPDNADIAGAMSNPLPPESDSSSAAPEPRSQTNAAVTFRGQGLDRRFFLLILKSGTEHVVTDYWVTDGYLEYVSRDGSRSHIPIDALDFQETVVENSHRGLPFVLRNEPASEDRF
jgi:hypothetical protein